MNRRAVTTATLTLMAAGATLASQPGCDGPGADPPEPVAAVEQPLELPLPRPLWPVCGERCTVLPFYLGGIAQIATAGFRNYAVTTDGHVYTWGDTHGVPVRPTLMPGLSGVVQVAAGFPANHEPLGCAVLAGGGVRCWADGGPPLPVDGLPGPAAQVTMGAGKNACVRIPSLTLGGWLSIQGLVGCWDASHTITWKLDHQEHLAQGKAHACTVSDEGTASCWGRNDAGELGAGSAVPGIFEDPQPVARLWGISHVFAGQGARSTFALGPLGIVYGWGWNYGGELADGTSLWHPSPRVITAYTGATSIEIGYWFSCAVMGDGTVKCAGFNDYGQLGDGTTSSRPTAAPVNGLGNVKQVALGDHHACALTIGGGVLCWGGNENGQLGDGTIPSGAGTRLAPGRVVAP